MDQLRTRLFDAFLGHEEGIHSVILPAIFSSGGSYNVYIDKYARVKKMPGYARQNSSALTTDTGASAAAFVGLFPYRKIASGTTTRQLVGILDDGVNEWEGWVSTDEGANWTFKTDFGSGSVNKIPDFMQFGNELYMTNGVLAPRVWDGSSWSTAGGTQSPTPTATASSTTGVLNGNYSYKLVSREADGSRHPGSAISTLETVQLKQIDLSWSADADTDVIGYEVYRTTGSGQTFMFVSWIEGRGTTSFTDNVSDDTVLGNRVLEEHGDAPPTGMYYVEPHKQRGWWFRTDTYPTRAWFSDAGDPDSVYANNNLDFSDSETIGDQITGAVGNFEGKLIVFTEKAVWTVSGTGAVIGNIRDWSRVRSNAQVGAASHRSIVRLPAGAKFADQNGVVQTTSHASIAYFTPNGDIRILIGGSEDAGDIIISLPVKDTLSTVNYAERHKIHALHDSVNQQVVWFYPDSSEDVTSTPTRGVVWNYRWGVWYPWTTTPFMSACEADSSTASSKLLVGQGSTSEGGLVYEFLTGTDFDGDTIAAAWMTKAIRGQDQNGNDDIHSTQRWRWLDILFESGLAGDITVEWLSGIDVDESAAVGSVIISPNTQTILSADGDVILSASGDPLVFSQLTTQAKVRLITDGRFLHDTGLRLRISDTSDSSSWAIEAMTVAYQTMEGQKRRFE